MDSKFSASTENQVIFSWAESRWVASRTISSTNIGRWYACSVTYFSSSRLSRDQTGLLAHSSISVTSSSIQMNSR